MSEVLVTAGGLVVILFIIWWFWFSQPRAILVNGSTALRILVKDGAYQPAALQVPAGHALTLTFIREDATACAEKVVFADLDLSVDLPLNQLVAVPLPALSPGRYEFTCQMGMYRGSLVAA